MAMSYDEKYRRRALDYWGEGHTKKETAAVFKVGTTTLQMWKSQLKETGKLESKKRRETWRKIDPEKLITYIEEHPDAYLKEIAAHFGCSDTAVIKALCRLNISRKKNVDISGTQ
jgi:transposase